MVGRLRMRRAGALVSALVVAGVLTAASGGSAQAQVDEDAVTAWNANAGEAAIAAGLAPDGNPLYESRLYAVMHLAIHDALNAIDRRSRPYAVDLPANPGASPEATVAAAARDVLVQLLTQLPPDFAGAAGVKSVEADYTAALAAIPDGPAKTQGVELGQAAAGALLALRAADGSDTPLLDFAYPQGTDPGEYRFTPGFPFAFAPGWADVTPFVLKDSSQFRPGPPYAVTSKKYTADFNEVKALGGDDVTTPSARTAEQTEIALFWVESSPLQWNRIARTVSELRRAGHVGERAAVRPAQHGPRRWLHRFLRDQIPLQLLATSHGYPNRGYRRQPQHQSPTRPGLRWCRLRQSRTTTRRTRSKAAQPRVSSSGSSAPTTSASRPAA